MAKTKRNQTKISEYVKESETPSIITKSIQLQNEASAKQCTGTQGTAATSSTNDCGRNQLKLWPSFSGQPSNDDTVPSSSSKCSRKQPSSSTKLVKLNPKRSLGPKNVTERFRKFFEAQSVKSVPIKTPKPDTTTMSTVTTLQDSSTESVEPPRRRSPRFGEIATKNSENSVHNIASRSATTSTWSRKQPELPHSLQDPPATSVELRRRRSPRFCKNLSDKFWNATRESPTSTVSSISNQFQIQETRSRRSPNNETSKDLSQSKSHSGKENNEILGGKVSTKKINLQTSKGSSIPKNRVKSVTTSTKESPKLKQLSIKMESNSLFLHAEQDLDKEILKSSSKKCSNTRNRKRLHPSKLDNPPKSRLKNSTKNLTVNVNKTQPKGSTDVSPEANNNIPTKQLNAKSSSFSRYGVRVPSIDEALHERDAFLEYKKRLEELEVINVIPLPPSPNKTKITRNELNCKHLTVAEIDRYFRQNVNFLSDIMNGKSPSDRHKRFHDRTKVSNILNLKDLTFSTSTIVFSYEQLDQMACLMSVQFDPEDQQTSYFFKVLIPELCLRIFMSVYNMSKEEADTFLENRPVDDEI